MTTTPPKFVAPNAIPDAPAPKPAVAPPSREQISQSFKDHGMASPFAEDSFGYQVGQKLINGLTGPNWFSSLFDRGTGPGAVAGGEMGAGLGFAGSHLFNMFSDRQMDPSRATMAGGLLGALLGGFRGHVQTQAKQGSFGGADLSELFSQVSQAALPQDVRFQVLAALGQLSPDEADQLGYLLRTASGATAGALITRFLFGKGLLSSLMGAMAGGYAGHSMTPNSIRSIHDIY